LRLRLTISLVYFLHIMKHFLISTLLAGLVFAESPVIGIVDYERVQSVYFRTQLEQQSFVAMKEEATEKLAAPMDEIRAKLNEQSQARTILNDPTLSLEKKQQTMDEARRRSTELAKLQSELEEKRQQSNAGLATHIAKVQAEIITEINAAIGEVAKHHQLAVVENSSFRSTGVPSLPYFSPELTREITDEVIAKLNANAPADWEPAESVPAESPPEE